MVKQQEAIFRYAHTIPPYWALRFDLEVPPTPGTYLLADLGGPLRVPLYPAALDVEGFTTMVLPGHPIAPGDDHTPRLLPGATVNMLGPLGRGFRLAEPARLLLIAQAAQLPPLLPLLETDAAIVAVVEAATRAKLPAPDHFPPEVELILVTCDGSAGYLGPLVSSAPAPPGLTRVTPLLAELVAWTECVCVACEPAYYADLAALVRETRIQPASDFAQVLVHTDMPCGLGACDVCRVPTRLGELRACVDGPVFDLLVLDYD